MAVVVVHQSELRVVVLAAPLDGLGDGTAGCHLAVGGVGVGGTDVAGGGVGFPDVLGEIPTVGVPCAVLLDGQGAGGNILCRVPGDEPEAGVGGALAVAAGYLQIATVEEAVAGGDNAVFRHHLGGAAAHVVVSAGHAHAVVVLGEKDGAACHARAACSGGAMARRRGGAAVRRRETGAVAMQVMRLSIPY